MRNPERTSWNLEYFKGMRQSDFVKYWGDNEFDSDPKKYYKKLTGKNWKNKKEDVEDAEQ